jgi:hypothetical protein
MTPLDHLLNPTCFACPLPASPEVCLAFDDAPVQPTQLPPCNDLSCRGAAQSSSPLSPPTFFQAPIRISTAIENP